MKIDWTLKNLKFGEIPDGVIVKVWFRIAKSQSFDWAIYSEYKDD